MKGNQCKLFLRREAGTARQPQMGIWFVLTQLTWLEHTEKSQNRIISMSTPHIQQTAIASPK